MFFFFFFFFNNATLFTRDTNYIGTTDKYIFTTGYLQET